MGTYAGKDDKKCQEAVNISLSDIQKESEDVSRETSSYIVYLILQTQKNNLKR